MTFDFYGNLDKAYQALEERLKKDRLCALTQIKGKMPKVDYELVRKFLVIVCPPKGHGPIDPRTDLAGRVALNLGNGYIAKFEPTEEMNGSFFTLASQKGCRDNSFEEENVRVLREKGFTQENGLYVPEHKVIGVSIVKNEVKLDTSGYGWVITEDISEGGLYTVGDVQPYHLVLLNNRQEFTEIYTRGLEMLGQLIQDPRFNPTVYRHGRPKNPIPALSKMLLSKVKDNVGKIVVGDLNNIRFDRR